MSVQVRRVHSDNGTKQLDVVFPENHIDSLLLVPLLTYLLRYDSIVNLPFACFMQLAERYMAVVQFLDRRVVSISYEQVRNGTEQLDSHTSSYTQLFVCIFYFGFCIKLKDIFFL